MLSDSERQRLLALQRELAADDPAFVRSFESIASRQAKKRTSFWWTATTIVLLVLGIIVAAAGFGATAFLLLSCSVACFAWRMTAPPTQRRTDARS